MSIVVLAGGVGAAKFLRGLIEVLPQEDIMVIGNTGDDDWFHGLYVSPDLDIVTYTLADEINPEMGWGLKGDTFTTLNALKRFGRETWFNLGDRDFATHIYRTLRLKEGGQLHEITMEIAKAFNLRIGLLPMSNEKVTTMVRTPLGVLRFEEYFVKHRFAVAPLEVHFQNIKTAKPAPGVLTAIQTAQAIILAPSNPIVSINTILSVPKIRKAIQTSAAYKIAISPIVGGKALKGPADRLLEAHGTEVSALGVAEFYSDLIDHIIIDQVDKDLLKSIEDLPLRATITNTIMDSFKNKVDLAKSTLEQIRLSSTR